MLPDQAQHLRADICGAAGQVFDECRLADTGFATDNHQPAVTGDRLIKGIAQPLPLNVATDDERGSLRVRE